MSWSTPAPISPGLLLRPKNFAEPLVVLFGHAEQVGDDEHGEGLRVHADELAPAVADELAELAVGEAPRELLVVLQSLRRDQPHQQHAFLRVHRGIHRHHVLVHGQLGRGNDRRSRSRRGPRAAPGTSRTDRSPVARREACRRRGTRRSPRRSRSPRSRRGAGVAARGTPTRRNSKYGYGSSTRDSSMKKSMVSHRSSVRRSNRSPRCLRCAPAQHAEQLLSIRSAGVTRCAGDDRLPTPHRRRGLRHPRAAARRGRAAAARRRATRP